MLTRRNFLAMGGTALAAVPFLDRFSSAMPPDIPALLLNAKAQFYNGLKAFISGPGAGGLTANQNVVLFGTIYPLDIDIETPYFNQELFRPYADRGFTGGIEHIEPNPQLYQAERVSYQYKDLLDFVVGEIDKKHPEMSSAMQKLKKRLTEATKDYTANVRELDAQ